MYKVGWFRFNGTFSTGLAISIGVADGAFAPIGVGDGGQGVTCPLKCVKKFYRPIFM